MTTTTTKDLEAEYRAKVAKIRGDPNLSWEKRELAVRQLGLEYDRRRRELEEEAA